MFRSAQRCGSRFLRPRQSLDLTSSKLVNSSIRPLPVLVLQYGGTCRSLYCGQTRPPQYNSAHRSIQFGQTQSRRGNALYERTLIRNTSALALLQCRGLSSQREPPNDSTPHRESARYSFDPRVSSAFRRYDVRSTTMQPGLQWRQKPQPR